MNAPQPHMIYEMAPNKEVISNGSHTLFFPVDVQTSSIICIDYDIYDNTKYDSEFKEILGMSDIHDVLYVDRKNIHKMLDYTCISDEALMNMMFLFSGIPTDKTDNTILNSMRRIGIDSFYSNEAQ